MTLPGWAQLTAFFAHRLREREIRTVLRGLARQRIVSYDGSLNAWIVEYPLPADSEALKTCQIRGWVEPLPHGGIEKRVFENHQLTHVRQPLYRLTDPGWNTINSIHRWIVWTFLVALVTLAATVLGLVISTRP